MKVILKSSVSERGEGNMDNLGNFAKLAFFALLALAAYRIACRICHEVSFVRNWSSQRPLGNL